MSRYIDADELIQALCADNDGIGRADAKAVMTCLEDVFSIVDEAPSIDIVRCKECKHRTDSKAKSFCEKWLREVDAEVFCSYGQKERASDD